MADTLNLKVYTPTREFFDGSATMVEFTTTEGNVGIYPKHVPTTAIIAPGTLTIHSDTQEKRCATLMSGFVEIEEESVTILAEVCEWPDEIDEARANEARIRAERRISEKATDLDLSRAELALKRALVRIDTKNR
jgi:ATP synthase F1, epsilon subunit